MHDPKVVAFDIPRPWPERTTLPGAPDGVRWRVRHHHEHWTDGPDSCGCPSADHNPFPWWKPRSYTKFWRLAGRDYYWPDMITVWHNEPGGRDSLTVCSRRYQDKTGRWRYTRGWRWHVHHWSVQVQPLQHLRRWALTRCAWCGGRSRKGDLVNHSHSWDGPRGHWWQGEPGLYHRDCSELAIAHGTCICPDPAVNQHGYGKCGNCGRFRPWGITPERIIHVQRLQSIPEGKRS